MNAGSFTYDVRFILTAIQTLIFSINYKQRIYNISNRPTKTFAIETRGSAKRLNRSYVQIIIGKLLAVPSTFTTTRKQRIQNSTSNILGDLKSINLYTQTFLDIGIRRGHFLLPTNHIIL